MIFSNYIRSSIGFIESKKRAYHLLFKLNLLREYLSDWFHIPYRSLERENLRNSIRIYIPTCYSNLLCK